MVAHCCQCATLLSSLSYPINCAASTESAQCITMIVMIQPIDAPFKLLIVLLLWLPKCYIVAQR